MNVSEEDSEEPRHVWPRLENTALAVRGEKKADGGKVGAETLVPPESTPGRRWQAPDSTVLEDDEVQKTEES